MQIQDTMKSLADGGCLIFCDCYLMGIPFEKVVEKFDYLLEKRIIESDCYVLSHENLIYALSGKRIDYVRTETMPKNTDYIVSYSYNGKSHFVVCNNGKVVFNPLENSQCVKYGKPNNDFRFVK